MRVIRELIPPSNQQHRTGLPLNNIRTEERTGVPKRAFRRLLGSVTQLFGMLRWQAQARSPTGQLNPRQLAGREGGKAERAPAQAAKPLNSVIHNTLLTQVSPFLFQ